MSKLSVFVNQTGFEYDIHSLIKAFYPECEVSVSVGELAESSDNGYPDILIEIGEILLVTLIASDETVSKRMDVNGFERVWVKNALKKLIYNVLSEYKKESLPWGTLTGIRPTKISRNMLDEGNSEEEIEEYMKNVYLLSGEKLSLAMDISKREKAILDTIHHKDGYSLYVGIPFCPTTCLYCSFTSFPIGAWKNRIEEYLDALFREIDYTALNFKDRILDTVYIGGGTPTTLTPLMLDRLLTKIEEVFDLSNLLEFTVEAGRPDSITEEKLKVLKQHKVTRISVNPQTMNQKTLDFIGRKHTVEDFLAAYELAKSLGFENINTDIILGLPGENEEDVSYTIEEIKKLSPDSLTVHSLAVKRASKLSEWIKENGIEAMKNTEKTMAIAQEGATKMGMNPYYLYRQKNMSGNFENVGYAKPGKEGIYNILIMEEVQTIIACGAGTVTKRVYGDGRIERCDNVKDVALYIDKIDEMIDRKRELFKD